jgi:redox-sensitive bicupin YhaK (pirin superfamily)
VPVTAAGDVALLLLAGQPLGQPVVGHGPFVMTSMAEIRTAIADFQSGRMGRLG